MFSLSLQGRGTEKVIFVVFCVIVLYTLCAIWRVPVVSPLARALLLLVHVPCRSVFKCVQMCGRICSVIFGKPEKLGPEWIFRQEIAPSNPSLNMLPSMYF